MGNRERTVEFALMSFLVTAAAVFVMNSNRNASTEPVPKEESLEGSDTGRTSTESVDGGRSERPSKTPDTGTGGPRRRNIEIKNVDPDEVDREGVFENQAPVQRREATMRRAKVGRQDEGATGENSKDAGTSEATRVDDGDETSGQRDPSSRAEWKGGSREKSSELSEHPFVASTAISEGDFCQKSDIQSAFKSSYRGLTGCLDRNLSDEASPGGKLVLQFKIGFRGGVKTKSVAEQTFDNPGLEKCMLREIDNMQFAKPDGGICISRYTVEFREDQ